MDKNSLLKSIALKGYDVGFGAKKHFATYDMASKIPNIIAIGTLAAGVIQLGFKIPFTYNQILSVVLIIISIIAIFVNQLNDTKKDYERAGVKLNRIYQDLRNLYFNVQGTHDGEKLQELEKVFHKLIEEFNNTGISHQMMFSDWYAHYKFFIQLETSWIEEQRPFTYKDKIPLALRWLLWFFLFLLGISIILIVILFMQNQFLQ